MDKVLEKLITRLLHSVIDSNLRVKLGRVHDKNESNEDKSFDHFDFD
mgnify:CR=1 FL=1